MAWIGGNFEGTRQKITLDGGNAYSFDNVEHFTYLGTEFGRKPGTKREIKRRLMMENRSLNALNE